MKPILLLSGALMLGSLSSKAFAAPELAQPILQVSLPSLGNFAALGNFEIRVEKIQPTAAADKLEVICTLSNRTESPQPLNGQTIRFVASNADGIGMLNDTALYCPTGKPELIQLKEPLKAGEQLQTRIFIRIPDGGSALTNLTIWENESLPQTIDLSSVKWPNAKPAFQASAMKLHSGQSEFQPCGETLDVRFDGFRFSRSGWYEAFFTFKNTADSPLYKDVLKFNSSALDLFTHGANGKIQRYADLMHANGEKATWIPYQYAILPGSEAHVRYTFSGKQGVPKPVKLTVGDRISKTTLDWSVSY